ncbi:MAG: cyclic nucleotide-binding domain-containing protein [Mariprofundaceae bacterium]
MSNQIRVSEDSIPKHFKQAFLEVAEPLRFLPGQHICREGDQDQTLYMLTEGELAVTRQDPDGSTKTIVDLQPGALFGEVNFIFGTQRIATVTAKKESQVYQIKRVQGSEIIAKTPGLFNYLQSLGINRWIITSLLTHPLLQDLPQDVLSKLIDLKGHNTLASGRTLFDQNKPIDKLWILISGSMEMFSTEGREIEFFDRGCLTPIEAMDHQPSNWKAVTVSECILVSLPLDVILKLRESHPKFSQTLEQNIIK